MPFALAEVTLLALAVAWDVRTIAIAAAILIVLAIVFALVIRSAVRRKLPPQLPSKEARLEQRPEAPIGEALPPVEVALPAERLARRDRARDDVTAAEAALAAAEARAAADPRARADVERRGPEVADAQRRLDYETRKVAESEEKARREAQALALARREQAAREAREAEETRERAAQQAQRAKLAEAEAGRTLAEGLAKTRGGFVARLNALLGTGKALDEHALGELEEILFSADVGVHTATHLLESVRERLARRELADLSKVKAALREEIERILSLGTGGPASEAGHGGLPDLPPTVAPPQVVMVVGVNGTGKTTTVGKLAARLRQAGRKVILGAGDTFRAAAGEQLDVWADRAQVPIVRGKDGSDPGAVLFDTVARAKVEQIDAALCDTAGRLHTKAGLMDELKRIKRTLEKAHAGSPHEILLVVDATTGQNAIAQARQFHEALGVTGFVLTKLDGTAKGGVIIGICDELKIPVRYVGIGEKVADLKPFDPHEFVEALFS
ncbi:MAG: signal recognition particle-docking protein FtsY [Myxococcales bacterium]